MKFTVAARDLTPVLQTVTPALSSGGDLSSHFVFRPHLTDEDKIEVLAFTGRVSAAAPFKALIEGKRESFTVEGARLRQWVSAVGEDAVLVFEFKRENGTAETTVTLLNDDDRKQYFPSLDPAHFPYTDNILGEARLTATVPADRLKEALARARLFVSEDEAKQQGLCVAEVRDGVLTSTNKASLCMITVPALKDATIRVHNKDAAAVLAFLTFAKSDNVEVLEHERTFFIRRPDGSYLGETRFHEAFPNISSPKQADKYQWEFHVEDVRRALSGLSAGASKTDDRLWITQRNDKLLFSMETSNGKRSTWPVPLLRWEALPDAEPLPESILITVRNLKRLLDASEGSVMKLGASPHKKSGYFHYEMTKHTDENGTGGDTTRVMLVWSKNQ